MFQITGPFKTPKFAGTSVDSNHVFYESSTATNLHDAVLEAVRAGVALGGANLDQLKLPGANLRNAQFAGCSMRGANLRGANLDGANLKGNLFCADLSMASAIGATLGNLENADLSDADLSSANIYRLRSTDLSGANLSGARIMVQQRREGQSG